MSKRGNSFSNSFAALSLHEEQEPKKVLQLQSTHNQKKLEYQARKALCGTGPSANSSRHKSHKGSQQKQAQTARKATATGAASVQQPAEDPRTDSDDRPESPGFLAALAAIEAAEQQGEAEGFWPQPQSGGHEGSLSASPSDTSAYSAWQSVTTAATTDENSTDPWDNALSSGQQQQQLVHQQQQEQDMLGATGSDPAWPHSVISSAQAYSWRAFAMSFAQAAQASGDEEAADGALQFGASDLLAAAVLATDDTAVAEMGEVAAEAAAVGLSVPELLQAQQEELLLQIERTKRKRRVWRPLSLDWGTAGSSSTNSSSCADSPVRTQPRVLLPDVGDAAAFPQLECSPAAASGAGWQQVGRSPHALPSGWKGGRLAPKASGIKLLNTAHSSSSSSHSQGADRFLRPSSLDLRWDLRMDGLAPMVREEDATSNPVPDPWGCGGTTPAGGLSTDEAAAQRTRELWAEQEAAAASSTCAGSSGRDRCGPDTVRSMMEKAASRSSRLAGAEASTCSSSTPAECGEADEADGGMCGSKASFTYSWSNVFKNALMAGWEPVGRADGGGGSHFKLRRVLPLSGVTQTMVLPCTPSDSQRGVRNVAAAFKKRDDEKVLLESQASAERQAAQQQTHKQGKRPT